MTLQEMAETEERSEGLTLQKIRAERPEAFLKEPQGNLLGTLWITTGHLENTLKSLKNLVKKLCFGNMRLRLWFKNWTHKSLFLHTKSFKNLVKYRVLAT